MLKLAVLGSGSSGNSAVLCLGDTRSLIDAGLSAKQLCLRLELLGIDPDSLSGIVLTHEHGDHTRGIDVFTRKRKLPVYATTHTCALVREQVKSEVVWRPFEAGNGFAIDGIQVESFSVPHDAVDPVGFVFRCERSSVGVLSDVGHVTRMIIDRLRGVDTLFTESNYDEVMLQNDTKRPWATKQRISNRHGHLSNDQTADLIEHIASPSLCRIVLGHLSSDCNTADLACSVIRRKLEEKGFTRVQVECADRNDPLPLRAAARTEIYESRNLEEKPAKTARVCESTAPAAAASQVNSNSEPREWSQTEWAF
jgi:phosphoribosyl 1,2-cyclic phosphodiesterase